MFREGGGGGGRRGPTTYGFVRGNGTGNIGTVTRLFAGFTPPPPQASVRKVRV